MADNEQFLQARDVCARYRITDRTLDRWAINGTLPQPVRMNGRRYWRQTDLERRERENMRGTAPASRASAATTGDGADAA